MSQNSHAHFKNFAADATGFLKVSLTFSRHYAINYSKMASFLSRTMRSHPMKTSQLRQGLCNYLVKLQTTSGKIVSFIEKVTKYY